MLDAFVKRFIAATSYSAFSLITTKLPPHLLQALTPVFIAGVVYCHRLRGVQNVLAMLAAQGVTDYLAVPAEPVGYLVLPAAMFYFSVVTTIGWGIHCVITTTTTQSAVTVGATSTTVDNAASTILDEYVGLFCTSKVVASFLAAKQEHVLGIMSFSYLVLPSSSIRSLFTAGPQHEDEDDNWSTWLTQLLGMVDSLAARGAMMWLGGLLTQWAAYGNGLFFLYLVILMTPVFDLTPKLMQCHGVLSLLCSRQAVNMLSVYKSTGISVAVFASCYAVLLQVSNNKRDGSNNKHVCTLSDTCFFGASIVLTDALTIWIDGCGPAEAACSYISIYVLLEALQKLGSYNSNTAAKGPPNIIIDAEADTDADTTTAALQIQQQHDKMASMANNLPLLPTETAFWS